MPPGQPTCLRPCNSTTPGGTRVVLALTQTNELSKLNEVSNRDHPVQGNPRLKEGALMITAEALRFLAWGAPIYLLMAGLPNFLRS
jgi:hypothetical protein